MIPKKNNCNPPMNMIRQAKLGQPLTGSPNTRVFITITRITIKEIKQSIIPTIAEITNGVVENANIPSKAYLKSFQKLNFDFPAILSGASYCIHLVLNPTKLNNPLE